MGTPQGGWGAKSQITCKFLKRKKMKLIKLEFPEEAKTSR